MEQSSTRYQHHIKIERATESAISPLATATGLSRQRIKRVMQQGALWLERNGETRRLRRAKAPLKAGDQLHLYYDEQVLATTVDDARLVADEDAFSIWYKPVGMLSQGSRWGDHCTINRWAEQHLQPQRPAFIVHRLDRYASGLIMIAHRRRTAAALAALFAARKVDKRYRAWVVGKLAESQPTRLDSPLDDRPAVSQIKLLRYDAAADRSLLEVTIETGRKHQIRRHLAGIDLPIVGDRRYGDSNQQQGLQLVSCYLAFPSLEPDGPGHCYQLPEELMPV